MPPAACRRSRCPFWRSRSIIVSTVERARPRGAPNPSTTWPTVTGPCCATWRSSASSWSPIDLVLIKSAPILLTTSVAMVLVTTAVVKPLLRAAAAKVAGAERRSARRDAAGEAEGVEAGARRREAQGEAPAAEDAAGDQADHARMLPGRERAAVALHHVLAALGGGHRRAVDLDLELAPLPRPGEHGVHPGGVADERELRPRLAGFQVFGGVQPEAAGGEHAGRRRPLRALAVAHLLARPVSLGGEELAAVVAGVHLARRRVADRP